MRLVIALGGNALLHRGERPDASAQIARITFAAPALAALAAEHEVVFVHGNGPQVGMLAKESADDDSLSAPYPLASLGAETQGLIGSLLAQALRGAGLAAPVVAVVTHAVVDIDDPAFSTPSKYIGPQYPRRRAERLAEAYGWSIAQDGDGWRRVVPSPAPRRIIELEAAQTLLQAGTTVIIGGGGGVPVIEDARGVRTVDAVIDKDRTAALVARAVNADRLIILTDVPGVIADYGTPSASVIAEGTPALLSALRLPSGSMGPKVDAVCDFVSATGRRAAIGALEHAGDVAQGIVGTQIVPPAYSADRSTARSTS